MRRLRSMAIGSVMIAPNHAPERLVVDRIECLDRQQREDDRNQQDRGTHDEHGDRGRQGERDGLP